MSILTFDLETCTKTLNKRKASPFEPENYVVASGYKHGAGETFGTYYTAPHGYGEDPIPFKEDTTLLVGFNIKFDLLWSWYKPELQEFFRRGGQIWDCQYVQYLLEGHRQHAQMASMDSCVESYGGTLKIDAVKELWNAGVDTPDIDETLLMDYLLGNPAEEIEGDVNNTYLIFLGQVERAKKIHPNFLSMIARRMDGLLATTEMEYNGLKIDTERGEADRAVLKSTVLRLDGELEEYVPTLPPELEFNWRSIYHRSYLIYGGAAKYSKWVQHTGEAGNLLYAQAKEKWPLFNNIATNPSATEADGDGELLRRTHDLKTQDVFKSGKRKGEGKTKTVTVPDLSKPKGAQKDHVFQFNGYTKPNPNWASTLTDGNNKPIFSTAADIITRLTERTDIPFLQALGQRAKASKDLGTYYWDENDKGERKGMLTLVDDSGFIHHKLNHVNTITTRLSSSDPNMQNIPRKDKSVAKALFVSRFGKDGRMIEIDYSQLEVVIQGVLSRDKQVIADLNAGVDFHCKRLAKKLNEPYDDVVAKAKGGDENYAQMRTEIKGFTFQRAYGAGPAAIAASTGMTEEEVVALIQDEERMYPGLGVFDQCVEASINATRRTTRRELFVAGKRFNVATGEWFSPTGTRYVWTEGEAPKFLHKKGKFVGFSPTERKNWPVQGDGGFVVQAMLGYLFRYMNKMENFGGQAFLVNTVHDCVWVDCHVDVLDKVAPAIKQILEAVPTMYKRAFNIDIPVQFPTETEVGLNMLDMEHYT